MAPSTNFYMILVDYHNPSSEQLFKSFQRAYSSDPLYLDFHTQVGASVRVMSLRVVVLAYEKEEDDMLHIKGVGRDGTVYRLFYTTRSRSGNLRVASSGKYRAPHQFNTELD